MNRLTFNLWVPCRNVIVLKWISDNPQYFRVEKDLYDMQVYNQLFTGNL